VEVAHRGRVVTDVAFVQGHLQVGYRDLRFRLQGGTLVAPAPEGMPVLVAARSEVWYWEIDRAAGRFVLRLLLWPQGRLAIAFTDLSYEATDRPDRDGGGNSHDQDS
jgi:hypothetical protein